MAVRGRARVSCPPEGPRHMLPALHTMELAIPDASWESLCVLRKSLGTEKLGMRAVYDKFTSHVVDAGEFEPSRATRACVSRTGTSRR